MLILSYYNADFSLSQEFKGTEKALKAMIGLTGSFYTGLPIKFKLAHVDHPGDPFIVATGIVNKDGNIELDLMRYKE